MATSFNIRGDYPAAHAFPITPNDSADLEAVTNGIYVGNTGNLTVIHSQDTAAVTYTAIPTGSLLPFHVKRVLASGTTATNLIGVY